MAMHLIITEKHDAALKIAGMLFSDREAGRLGGVTVYRSKAADAAIVGLAGHIVELDFPDEYRRWSAIPPSALIDAPVVSVPTKKDLVMALASLAPSATRVTIATDYDREGELIGVEAYRLVRRLTAAPFDRVRYSSFARAEIQQAFARPVPLDFSLAEAGECRQEIDLVWGAALTRFASLAGNRRGRDFLSVGRVQTPLLALIVDREKEIGAFASRPYWEVVATLARGGEEFTAMHAKGRFASRGEAAAAHEKLGNAGLVTSVRSDRKTEPAPTPFNTTELLKAAAAIGYGAADAMRVAEGLYIDGWISYPRTDNTVYPASLDLRQAVGLFKASPDFAASALELLGQNTLTATRGKIESKDHPPIYPVACAERSRLDGRKWKLYELVVRRFFATLASPCAWEVVKAAIDIGGEPFTADGKRLAIPGWRKHYAYGLAKDEELPPLAAGDALAVRKAGILEKKTEPPKRYGQGRLMEAMEKLGLGTKATRHEALDKLYQRGYVEGNPPKPTQTGITLVDALKAHAAAITGPAMTARLEGDMDGIAEGRLKKAAVVSESRAMLRAVFDGLESNRDSIARTLRSGAALDSPVGPCPACGSPMVVREARADGKKFIACTGFPECRNTYGVPPGKLKFEKKACERHKLHFIKVTPPPAGDGSGKKARGKAYEYGCPACRREGQPPPGPEKGA